MKHFIQSARMDTQAVQPRLGGSYCVSSWFSIETLNNKSTEVRSA